jgi:hypothetical protein
MKDILIASSGSVGYHVFALPPGASRDPPYPRLSRT